MCICLRTCVCCGSRMRRNFFHGSLLENLLFGVKEGDEDADLGRVLAICRMVGLNDEVVGMVEHSEEVKDWNLVLSKTSCHLLNIARALVANPDVLCMDDPLSKLDLNGHKKIINVLREFVKSRGILNCYPESMSRSRTVLYTACRCADAKAVDGILFVPPSGVIQHVETKDITDAMVEFSAIAAARCSEKPC